MEIWTYVLIHDFCRLARSESLCYVPSICGMKGWRAEGCGGGCLGIWWGGTGSSGSYGSKDSNRRHYTTPISPGVIFGVCPSLTFVYATCLVQHIPACDVGCEMQRTGPV